MAKKFRLSKLSNKGSGRTTRNVKRVASGKTAQHSNIAGLAKFTPSNIWASLHKKQTWVRIGQITAAFFGLIALIFLWYAKDLPSPNKINARLNAQTTRFYDRTGQTVLYEVYGDKNRTLIEFSEMPDYCKQATVAIEDKDFYKHGAFSITGLFRAFYYTVFKRNTQGGSTITQQYVKNAFLTGDRTIPRKIKELIISIEIETLYKKDDILKLYLNEIPYGSTAYGLQAAAKTYFGKDAKELDLPQCAMLAALPQAPSYYSPYGQRKESLVRRQHRILDLMADQKYISTDQAESAKATDILAQVKPQNLYANVTAPHYVAYVRELLEEKYGVKTVNEGGLKVITTLDIEKQKIAEEAVASGITNVRRYGGSNAALVSSDAASSEVLAMVGSYNYGDPEFGSYNVAAAERQPGSSFKPITYATLFKTTKWGPGSTLYDVTTDFGGGYKPKNYTNRTYGVVSVRQALASSLNIPAVKSLYLGGIQNALNTASDLGITTLTGGVDRYGLSLTLGTGEVKLNEMVNAFEAFPTGGQHRKQVYVLKITNSSGKVLEENKPENNKAKQVFDPQIAYSINNILSDNNARCSLGVFSCRNPLTLANRPVAAKTGTTDDYRDAWTMGYTKRIVTGVWAGNNNNSPMTQAASIVSAPIWNEYMTKATANDPIEQFDKPSGLQQITLDAETGKLPTTSTRKTRTDIFPSWYKAQSDSSASSGKVDKISGKLATDCTPAEAIEVRTSGTIQAEIPPNDPSYGRWNPPVQALAASLGYGAGAALPTEKDNIHNCSDTKPSVTLSVSPNSGSTFFLTATGTSGTFQINNYIFYFDGQQIASGPNNTLQYTPAAGTSGNHAFAVKVYDTALYSAVSGEKTVTVNSGSTTVNLICVSSSCTAVVNNAPSGSWKVKISINGGSFGQSQNGSGGTGTFNWAVPASGSARVQVYDNGDGVVADSGTKNF